MNMLITEWNWDDAKEVWYTEGREDGWNKGLEEGLSKGLEEVARKALEKGMPPDTVSEITGLDRETLKKLAGE
jgi:predicted transposase YdaD